jgi:TRAP-type C4-dicarboxylate transport system permease small subunit
MAAGKASFSALMGRLLGWLARLSLVLACLSLAALVILFVGVIGLRLVGHTIPSADDIAGILLGGTLALGFASVVPKDQHIALDYLVDRIGGMPAAALRVLGYAVSIGIIGYLLIGFARMWYSAYVSGFAMLGALPIPRALPMGIVLAGIAMLELALVLRFLERAFGAGFGPAADAPAGAKP